MSDKLEDFVRNNREKFDTQTPKTELWDKIQQGLQAHAGPGTANTGAEGAVQSVASVGKTAAAWKIGAAALAVLAAVTTVWVISTSGADQKTNTTADAVVTTPVTPAAQNLVNPPLPSADQPFQKFVIDSEKGGSFTLANGTLVSFPDHIFVDKNGAPVLGDVEISYREFHDAADIILSGIPMTYNHDGKEELFETAGMIEIRGFKEGAPVDIAPGKTVKFEMATFAKEDNYNFYHLDPEKGAWVDKGRPKMGKNPRKTAEPKTSEVESDEVVEVRKPVDPKRLKPETEIAFDVKNTNDFPELKPYKNIRWVAQDPAFLKRNEWIFSKIWSDIQIEEIPGQEMAYNMILKNKTGKFTLPVNPILEEKDYKTAMADFKARKNRSDDIKRKKTLEADRIQRQADLTYSFEIAGFGIFNCDRFYSSPSAVTLHADFAFDESEYVNGRAMRIFHVVSDRSVRALDYKGARQLVTYDLERPQYFVALLSEGRVAMAGPEDLKLLAAAKGKKVDIPMHSSTAKIANGDDLRDLLNL